MSVTITPPAQTRVEITGPDSVRVVSAATQGPAGADSGVAYGTLAALTSATPPANGTQVLLRDAVTNGGGGGGVYAYNSASAATANDGTVIAPASGVGRYIRQLDAPINVRVFGAGPGYSVADNRTAFLAAIAAAKRIYVPSGTYAVDGIVGANGTFIEGENPRDTVLQVASTTAHAIKFEGGGGVGSAFNRLHFGVSKLRILGPSSGTGHGVYLIRSSYGWTLNQLEVVGFGSHGINLSDSYTGTISDCVIDTNGGDGIHGETNINAILFQRVCSVNNAGAGLQIIGGAGCVLNACDFESNDTYGYDLRYTFGFMVIGGDFENNGIANAYIHRRNSALEPANATAILGGNYSGGGVTPDNIVIDDANMVTIDGMVMLQAVTGFHIKVTSDASRVHIGSVQTSGVGTLISDAGVGTVYAGYDTTNVAYQLGPQVRFVPRATNPPVANVEGMFWYDSVSHAFKYWNGTAIKTLAVV